MSALWFHRTATNPVSVFFKIRSEKSWRSIVMPALSTTYTNYSSSNTQRYSTTTGFSLLRPYTSTSSSLPYKSKSSYDLANSTPHRSSISSTYSSSSSTSSSKLSPSYSSSEYSYSSYKRPISGTSGTYLALCDVWL